MKNEPLHPIVKAISGVIKSDRDGWISVEERDRIPLDQEFYLIAVNGVVRYGNYWTSGEYGWHDTDGEMYHGVTHWRPLPEPPKE